VGLAGLRGLAGSVLPLWAACHDHGTFTTDKNWYGQGESDCLIKT
jgi:hypothetical protein